MDNKKKIILSGLAVTLVAGATSGAALAYLTDGETAENTFTIGDVSIEGIEPNYPGNDCDEVKDIVPNNEIAKDPQIDNNGINDAIVFMTVDSPMELVTVVSDNGSHLQDKGVNELFWFKDAEDALSTHANNFSQDWQELSAKEMYVKIAADGSETQLNASTPAELLAAYNAKAADEHIVKRYVFGYTEAIQGSSTHDGTAQTAENKVTAPLFDKVQLKNVIENEIDEAVEKIVVRSYAIQATKILENSVDLAANLNEANLGKIYDIFIRQNSAQDDASGLKVEGLRGVDTLTPTSNGASGTTDEHKNRFGTTDDVESENCNLNPEKCQNGGSQGGDTPDDPDPVDPTPADTDYYGTWYTSSCESTFVEVTINSDGTYTRSVDGNFTDSGTYVATDARPQEYHLDLALTPTELGPNAYLESNSITVWFDENTGEISDLYDNDNYATLGKETSCRRQPATSETILGDWEYGDIGTITRLTFYADGTYRYHCTVSDFEDVPDNSLFFEGAYQLNNGEVTVTITNMSEDIEDLQGEIPTGGSAYITVTEDGKNIFIEDIDRFPVYQYWMWARDNG